MFRDVELPLNAAYMRMFEQPIIFNFNPDYNLYLSKKSFKIIAPSDFNVLSLPSQFEQMPLSVLKKDEDFREKTPQLFQVIPKEILVAKDARMKAFADSLIVPLVSPPEFQGSRGAE